MSVRLEVWGDFALFTRPELKTERVSYDVMTPSAARGILEAIFWHPGLRYHIRKIYVCSPIRFSNIRRNEVGAVIEYKKVQTAMKQGRDNLWIATSENIAQRASLLLRDVHYVIEADFEMTEKAVPSDNPGKFQEMLTRRIRKGQFYSQPYFGCREFPVYFQHCEQKPACPDELKGIHDLGLMLYDMDYSDSSNIHPLFFRAKLIDGILTVPSSDSEEVYG